MAADYAAGSVTNAHLAEPGRAATANEISRRLGIPPSAVESDWQNMLARDRLRSAMLRARENTSYATMMSNPRFARAAINDDSIYPLATAVQTMREPGNSFSARRRRYGILGAVLRSFRDTLTAAGASVGAGAAGLARGTFELAEYTPLAWGYRKLMGHDLYGPFTGAARAWGEFNQEYQEFATVDYGNWYVNTAFRGVESVPQQAAALVAASRGNPRAAIALLSAVSGGQAYSQAREAGLDPLTAARFGATQGGLEAAGEAIPIFRFVGDALRGSGFFRTMAGQIVAENVGEQFTGHFQDLNEWATLEANQGRTFDDYMRERPQAALEIAIATTAAVGLQTGTAYGLNRVIDRAARQEESRRASQNINRVMDAAADSPTRTANPSDFEDTLASQFDGMPGENLYVPAETVRSLFQSPEDLASDDFWGAYSDQVNEAEALKGDVVIPLASAATHLAGTPQWEAIKDQVRGSPGGFSRVEIEEAETAFAEAAEKTGEEFAAILEAERAQMEPVQKVYEAMRDKLMLAGFTPDAASQTATLFAQRQRVRAERLGMSLTGEEADVIDIRVAPSDQEAQPGRVLAHSYREGPRGRITFATEGPATIDLFENRNLSTAIHEFGHLFLEEMMADAAQATALDNEQAKQIFGDWEAVKAWFAREGHAVGEDGVIPTEAHELFARSFERFAMEGKAPSSALKRAFEAFRSWLLTIYKVVDNLRAPITPDIRDVMTRLLATDEEITAAAEEQQIKALFNTAEEAGMTEAEFKAYQTATQEARSEAYDALLYRTMASIRAQRTKEYRNAEANVRAEAMAQVDNQPVFKALRLLRNGRIGDEEPRKVKLDRQFLIDSYGPEAIDAMPRSVPPIYGIENTAHPDLIAEETGFASGDELIRTLMGHEQARQALKAAGDKRSPRQVQIDEMTAARMAERYGDPLRDGSIEEKARALIHNDRQGEVIASEIRALARRANRKPTPYSIARKWAAEKVAASQVRETASGAAIQQYQRAAQKAAKAAEDAMLKGDVDETYRQKQAQMLNNALISEAKKAKDQVDLAVRRLSRTARRKTATTIAQDYLDQAHQLLEQVDLKTRSQRAIDRQQSFEAWAAEQRANGHDVVVPDSFAATIGQTHWSRLTVEQLTGLDDTVKQILHLGRLKQTLLDGQERRAREEVIAEMQAAGEGLRSRPPTALNDPDRSRWQALKSRLRGADAALIKIEFLVDWLDGGNSNGVFNRMVFKPLADAQGREADLMRDYVGRVNEAIDAMPRKQLRDWNRRVGTPELINRIPDHPFEGEPWSFYKDQIVMMALNMGNEGNRQRLLDGYGWSEAQVRAVLDRHMKAEDWQFVQSVWDIVDSLWPQIEALEKRVNGVVPEKVEAAPVDTPFGTFRGGYFPAVYDQQWSSRAEKEGEADLLERGYVRANVRASATKERADRVKRPIQLSMSVITRHLGEVIHDITHREALTETWRVVSDERVERVITNAMGREYTQLLRPWLKHIANDQARNANSNGTIVSIFRRLRTNVSLVGLGYRLTSTIAQIAGMPNIIARIGERRMAEGWARFLSNPVSAYREVTTKSAEMRDRFSTMDRDIVERAQQQSKARGIRAITGPAWFTKYAYHGILIMDSILTTAGWIGAYRKATAEGMSEEEAIYFADKTVRKSQGAGGAKDQAALSREHEAVRIFWMFSSYFSALYNQQRELGHMLRRISGARDVGKAVHFGLWVVIMPPLVDAIIRGELPADGDDDDEETVAGWASRKIVFGNVASLPFIRDIGSAIDRDFGYKVTPVQNVGESLNQGWNNIERMVDGDPGTEPSSKWVRQTITMLGLVTGRPTGQIANTVQFGYDVATAEAEPETLPEWYEGATRGRIED